MLEILLPASPAALLHTRSSFAGAVARGDDAAAAAAAAASGSGDLPAVPSARAAVVAIAAAQPTAHNGTYCGPAISDPSGQVVAGLIVFV